MSVWVQIKGRIKQLRIANNWSHTVLAKNSGVATRTVRLVDARRAQPGMPDDRLRLWGKSSDCNAEFFARFVDHSPHEMPEDAEVHVPRALPPIKTLTIRAEQEREIGH